MALLKISQKGRWSPRYEVAVNDLAQHDPVLAYRLRNQSKLRVLDEDIRAYYEDMAKRFGDRLDPHAKVTMPVMESVTMDLLRTDALSDLADYAKRLAWSIGPITRYRTGSVLRRQSASTESDADIQRWLKALDAQLGVLKSQDDSPQK